MREIRTSGLTSGDGKRGGTPLPRSSSTLPVLEGLDGLRPIDRGVCNFANSEERTASIDHGYSAPIHDGVEGDMAACGVWCVSVNRAGYCSMA
jgi:hypothetical protein